MLPSTPLPPPDNFFRRGFEGWVIPLRSPSSSSLDRDTADTCTTQTRVSEECKGSYLMVTMLMELAHLGTLTNNNDTSEITQSGKVLLGTVMRTTEKGLAASTMHEHQSLS